MKQLKNFYKQADAFFKKNKLLRTFAFAIFVLGVTNKIYFKQFYLPTVLYWDEAYHIPAAAKYITHTHFMEPHPPLGKMIIAWGEMFLTWGETQFGWSANHGQTFGLERMEQMGYEMANGFTYTGYRLFPALAGWLNSLLFALILFELTGSFLWALAFVPLYAFDNALIANFRGAMLDSLMIFGCLLCVWGFLRLINLKRGRSPAGYWALFLMTFGISFAVLTKYLSLIFILLWPALWWFKRRSGELGFFLKATIFQLLFFIVFFLCVWGYHFSNSEKTVLALRYQGMFYASSDYEKVLIGLPNDMNPVEKYFVALRDNLRFFQAYEKRVPQLNLDIGQQTGSFPIWWPFGARPIYFRNTYPQEPEQRHLFMMANPAIWFSALLGLILAIGGLVTGYLMSIKVFTERSSFLMGVFAAMYFAYMIVVSGIRRMLYLTHYFIPLFLTFFILPLVVREIYYGSKSRAVKNGVRVFLAALPVAAFGFYMFIKPLTYYEATTCEEAYKRAMFRFWNVKVNFCKDPLLNLTFLGKPLADDRRESQLIIDKDVP